jgi:8-oxo-dGTP pyrophosphatase MutT (NUDIX family)
VRNRTVEIEVEPEFLYDLATGRGDEDTRTEVILVLPRPGGKVLLITKPFYPRRTFRMPSGGVKPGESPEDAFRREVHEETGLDSEPVLTIETMILRCRSGEDVVDVTSHVILGSATSASPHANDLHEQISGYREIEPARLRDIADELANLPGRWRGWGLFRAPAHLAAADYPL